jgi:hypothetical protein
MLNREILLKGNTNNLPLIYLEVRLEEREGITILGNGPN